MQRLALAVAVLLGIAIGFFGFLGFAGRGGVPQPMIGYELHQDANLPGADLVSDYVTSDTISACSDLCSRTRGCTGFVFSAAGQFGHNRPRCWLKTGVLGAPKPDRCCVTGLRSRT